MLDIALSLKDLSLEGLRKSELLDIAKSLNLKGLTPRRKDEIAIKIKTQVEAILLVDKIYHLSEELPSMIYLCLIDSHSVKQREKYTLINTKQLIPKALVNIPGNLYFQSIADLTSEMLPLWLEEEEPLASEPDSGLNKLSKGKLLDKAKSLNLIGLDLKSRSEVINQIIAYQNSMGLIDQICQLSDRLPQLIFKCLQNSHGIKQREKSLLTSEEGVAISSNPTSAMSFNVNPTSESAYYQSVADLASEMLVEELTAHRTELNNLTL
jgi:hypothetical protein